ncbi:MAG TPA: helix-turn-helix domain-containing protein [Thermoanaerobaculia bacterium]|nr:helix-turn-helix domain-containing protein [Thermoanaerobaculia bacterium]
MKVLLVDPQDESRDALRRSFAGAGDQVRGVPALAEAGRQLVEFAPDAVVAALDFPEEELFAFFDEALRLDSRRALYALADSGALESGVRAMRRGAHDFLWRPVSPGRVALLRSRLESRRERERWLEEMRVRLARAEIASSLAGRSARWRAALSAIEREASNESAVLVTGEPGTEKEAAALAIHRLSRRGSEPFVSVAADRGLPVDGAGGTLFVTGVIRCHLDRQRLLLAEIEKPAGRRLVLSTNQDPRMALEGGRLLPELAAAVESHVVHLPPLRERGEDVELLARRFLQDVDGSLSFEAEAMDALLTHPWPGNLEELRDAVRRAASLADGPLIGATVVTSVLGRPPASRRLRRKKAPTVRVAVGDSLANVERRLILNTLKFARGNKKKTAELLKLSLKTIYNKIKEYGLEH